MKKFMKVINQSERISRSERKDVSRVANEISRTMSVSCARKTLAAPSSRFVLVWHPTGRVSDTMFLASHNLSGEVNRCNLKGGGREGMFLKKLRCCVG